MAVPGTIAIGATGSVVRWAQYLLVRRTLSYQQIDGIFGPATKAAVEQFQGCPFRRPADLRRVGLI